MEWPFSLCFRDTPRGLRPRGRDVFDDEIQEEDGRKPKKDTKKLGSTMGGFLWDISFAFGAGAAMRTNRDAIAAERRESDEDSGSGFCVVVGSWSGVFS